jgi:hypothetical protein
MSYKYFKHNGLKKGQRFIFAFIFFTFHFSLFTSAHAAHRFHTSLTRMDYNAESKSVEISILLFTHDMVEVLEKRQGKKINPETKEIDQLIFEYVQANFVLQGKDGKSAEIKWVGKETKVDTTWVYLEIPFNESLSGAKLQNTIFFETYQEQTNHVICRFEQKKADLLYKVGDKIKEIQVGGSGESRNN